MREIFVFSSNTEGRHGKGLALEARQKHGAIYGQARGFQGNSYAIVTKDLSKGIRSIPLDNIAYEVKVLLEVATSNSLWTFNVPPIGCGLAGYKPEEIAPMFKDAPPNVKLCEVFLNVLNKNSGTIQVDKG